MSEWSWWWDGTTVGDVTTAAVGAPYNSLYFTRIFRILFNNDRTIAGPVYGYENELAVTAAGVDTVEVATGAAMVTGRIYENNGSAITLTNPTPGAARTDTIILRLTTAAQTVRAVWKVGATLQQDSTVWEIALATLNVTAAGAITVQDMRCFLRANVGSNAESVQLAADDTTFTADAWNNLGPAATTMTLTRGTWLVWGTLYWENTNSVVGGRGVRIYDNTSTAIVCQGYDTSEALAEGRSISTMPRVYTITGPAQLALQFYARDAGDSVYGGTGGGSSTANATGMVALRVAA